jgi:hypothetical protein
MLNQYNPFKENRTEQMKNLWKYYVPFPGLDSAGKPVVVQGGRGSGKTMFFQCNSWRQVLSKISKEQQPASKLIDDIGFVGIYYRVDTTFVSSMIGREEEHWNSIFETYFSICIVQEILDLIITLSHDMPINENELSLFVYEYSKRFNPNSLSDSLNDFRQETNIYLDVIEDKINGYSNRNQATLRWVNAHRLISDICGSCNKLFGKDVLFKIFIDEYETLQEYQQKIINTLIKHSTLPVIFNIGLRPKGMKTKETISKTETIEAPHDYELITLGIDSTMYLEILRKICEKRILMGKEQGKIPANAPDDIEYYLGTYKVDDEIALITNSSLNAPHLQELKKVIAELGKKQGCSKEEIQEYTKTLCNKAPLINSRLHYALLCQQTIYTPTLKELYKAYIENTKRYTDWMHNRKYGLVFLLCKEFKRQKLYYGFEVYAALSSNIVRYFLELCEQAFQIAFLDNYSWNSPISPEIQTEAAKHVSEYKVLDIAGYEPYGKELRIFIQYLGQIFYRLHTADLNTLGEPEPNHFSTKDLSLPSRIKELISSAIMWNVLQEGEPTKRKQSKLSPETVDYYMNKIYVPYFGISYRNQRKIQLDVSILKLLFSGDDSTAKMGFRNYFKLPKESPEPVQNLGVGNQISFFDFGQGGKL